MSSFPPSKETRTVYGRLANTQAPDPHSHYVAKSSTNILFLTADLILEAMVCFHHSESFSRAELGSEGLLCYRRSRPREYLTCGADMPA